VLYAVTRGKNRGKKKRKKETFEMRSPEKKKYKTLERNGPHGKYLPPEAQGKDNTPSTGIGNEGTCSTACKPLPHREGKLAIPQHVSRYGVERPLKKETRQIKLILKITETPENPNQTKKKKKSKPVSRCRKSQYRERSKGRNWQARLSFLREKTKGEEGDNHVPRGVGGGKGGGDPSFPKKAAHGILVFYAELARETGRKEVIG